MPSAAGAILAMSAAAGAGSDAMDSGCRSTAVGGAATASRSRGEAIRSSIGWGTANGTDWSGAVCCCGLRSGVGRSRSGARTGAACMSSRRSWAGVAAGALETMSGKSVAIFGFRGGVTGFGVVASCGLPPSMLSRVADRPPQSSRCTSTLASAASSRRRIDMLRSERPACRPARNRARSWVVAAIDFRNGYGSCSSADCTW